MIAQLGSVLAPIHATAVSIEGAFLRAGDGLSRGLGSFEALKTNMSALGEQLARGGMETAVESLGTLSRDLVAISDGLPRDRATLEELVACNKLVSVHIETLIENMRMMTILARSARIEAVVFDRQGDGFVDFTQEIMALTRNVHADIERCARDHLKLSGLLGTALKAQLGLERSYREKLVDLARELTDSVGTICQRRETGSDLMGEVGRRADGIASAARNAIMSLQAGDSTRQRLEHVHHGLSVALSGENSDPDDGYLALLAAMCRLQRAQLQDAVTCFDQDVGSIDGALQLLLNDTRDIVALGRDVYGGEGPNGSTPFLVRIRERLADAAEHIRTCEASREAVGEVVSSLCGQIDALRQAVSAVSEVVPDIMLIGLNAGLKAGRLGPKGRSMVVIADELKGVTNAISASAKTLLPIFSTLGDVSGRLGPAEPESGRSIVNEDMNAIVAALASGGATLGHVLGHMEKEASRFESDLDQSRSEFVEAGTRNRNLLAAAKLLEGVETKAVSKGVDFGSALALVDRMVGSTYTMAREREIHNGIVGSHSSPVETSSAAESSDDLGGVLF